MKNEQWLFDSDIAVILQFAIYLTSMCNHCFFMPQWKASYTSMLAFVMITTGPSTLPSLSPSPQQQQQQQQFLPLLPPLLLLHPPHQHLERTQPKPRLIIRVVLVSALLCETRKKHFYNEQCVNSMHSHSPYICTSITVQSCACMYANYWCVSMFFFFFFFVQ